MDSAACNIASTSTAMNVLDTTNIRHPCLLSDLPENLIRAIFDHLAYKDVLRSHQVSRRLRKVLRRNAHYLSRPTVSEMSIKMGILDNRSRPFGRLQPTSRRNALNSRRRLNITFSRRCTSPSKRLTSKWKEFNEEEDLTGGEHKMSTFFLDALSESLKQVNVDGRLSFCGVTIDASLYERLTRNSVHISKARDLVFTLCRFHLGTEQLRDLLMRTNCQKLNLELSQFDDDILNDYLLEGMSDCREFSASTTLPKYFGGLTDRTLNRWATQERLPTRIHFQSVCANFTLNGVLTLLNSLQVKNAEMFAFGAVPTMASTSIRYEWNFGCVRLTEGGANILELMSMPGFVVHACNNDVIPNVLDISLSMKNVFPLSFTHCDFRLPTITLQLAMSQNKTN
uniref:F-box domain-containing protein n=1 Tax=Parascaris univalens TaxID=6257 RepID=A0A915CCB0_PARUN